MHTIRRCLADYRGLWRLWLPLSLVTLFLPLVVVGTPLVEKRLIDEVVLGRRLDLLPQTVVLYAGIWLVSMTGNQIHTVLRAYLGERLTVRLRERLLAHCEKLSLAFSHREHSGRTTGLFLNDVPRLSALLSATVFSAVGSVIMLVIAIAFMFGLSRQLAIVVGIVPPVVAALAWAVTRPLRPASERVQAKAAQLNERLQENLAGIREIVAFGQGRSQGLGFASTMGELLQLRMRVTFMDTGLRAGQMLFALTMSLVILGYGGYLVMIGQATLGSILAVRALFSHVFVEAGNLVGSMGDVQKALASADRIYTFLDRTPQVQERAGARPPGDVLGAVTFDRVSFAYHPGRRVLQQVSFTAHPGELVALVGPSGAGKSTLATLIARFYDPTEGSVLLDGVDLRELTLAGLRDRIGLVFQDTFLFATTVGANIAFGREGAGEAEVVAAARAAHAWEFIERLPEGLATQVGERGVRLSEGQKQRLAIARALLRDPRILILDEPTSALDARSEHLLQAALKNLMSGRTTFVLAHRLATVQRADRILVLDSGRLVEQGTHDELLRRRGLYRELSELQFGGVPLGTAGHASTGSGPDRARNFQQMAASGRGVPS